MEDPVKEGKKKREEGKSEVRGQNARARAGLVDRKAL